MVINKKNLKGNLLTALTLFVLVFLTYKITGPEKKTYYDYSVRLADAFLHGRLYLLENPPWLNELVPDTKGRYYVVYPPTPALLLMPFVFLFGPQFNQTLFSQLIGSLNVVLAYTLFLKLNFKQSKARLLSLLLALGTNHWYLASVGSAWYLALIMGVFFTLLSLQEFFGKRRFFLVGLFIGAAYWARLPVILSVTFPCFYVLFKEKNKIKSLLPLLLGVLLFVLMNFFYNYSRFGTIFDVGYIKIPGVLEETDFKYGLFSSRNIPKQLRAMFLEMPRIIKKPPYIYPSWYGMAIWLTTPAYFLILKTNFKKRLSLFCLVTVLFMSLPALTHATVGFTQFGYRYAMDFTPFLVILTGLGMKNTNKIIVYFLIFLSFVINLWGVLWINKFNWVGW